MFFWVAAYTDFKVGKCGFYKGYEFIGILEAIGMGGEGLAIALRVPPECHESFEAGILILLDDFRQFIFGVSDTG